MQFIYTNDLDKDKYESVINMRICDMISKHVMSLNSKKAQDILKLSMEKGIHQSIWGYDSNYYSSPKKNRVIQLFKVENMIMKMLDRPFRIVIDTNGVAWLDNVHSGIRDIIVFGSDITVSKTRYYIVDLRDINLPIIVDPCDVVDLTRDNIRGIIDVSLVRQSRALEEFYTINYTIGDLMRENGIVRENMILNSKYFDIYLEEEKERGHPFFS